MSAADNPFVTNAMRDAFREGKHDCCYGEYGSACCESAGIAAAFRAKNAEISDDQIDYARLSWVAPTYPRPGRRSALRKLFLGVEVSE